MNKTGLGRGLSALIPTNTEISKDDTVTEIEISKIRPNSYQPRSHFDPEKLEELASSIKEHGVVQPVVVRPVGPDRYELVVGERRLRACEKLMLNEIPAVIKYFNNEQMMEIALIENIQRQDLNPIEEATAYKRLIEEFKLTQEQVAQRVSKSRSLIANMVRLLNLPDNILAMVSQGQLSVGHARPLLAVEEKALQKELAEEMIAKSLNVREAENLVRKALEDEGKNKKEVVEKEEKTASPFLYDLEEKLRNACGTKVKIKDQGEKGRIEIDYYNNDDLERIITFFLKEDQLL